MAVNNAILLFGGTFDPIHNGHLIIARAVAEQLAVEKVILIPSAVPPHKMDQQISPAADRLQMTQLAVSEDYLFEVSDCELHRSGPSYTLETVLHFRQLCGPAVQLFWLIGADTISDLPGWYKISDLLEHCTIVTAARAGCEMNDWHLLSDKLTSPQILRLKKHVLQTPLIEISATEIRRRVKNNQSIHYLVPAAVNDYIVSGGLYQ
ncbi:MAG: nicotinate-nucleotide adenylyltransferase [Sedimentisphaerales bacterium]|nr:nicotinate-nucleotide adenylyltransferase [Sedimentisphaerales bacterium]